MARAGREDEARDLLQALLEEHPDHVRTMVQLAKLEASTGRVPEALRRLNKARDADPRSVPTALALVDLHLRLGDPEQALRVADEAEDSAPENLEVLAAVGRSHIALGREDLARELYTRMVRVAGFDAGKLYGVTELQLAVGALKDAAYTLTKALKGDPEHLRVQILLAETQIRIGKLAEARERAQALLEKYPNLVATHGLLGDVQMAMAEPKAARASDQSAMAIEPSSRLAVKRFEATVAAGETQAAMRELATWVEARPADRLALRALAEGRLAAGDYDVARGLYERLLEFDPDDAKALNNLAHILDRLGDDRALEVAARARTLAPEDPVVSDTFGWLLVRAGEVERGLGHLRDAHARASSHPEIQYHLGAALAALGRSEEARHSLEQALARSANFDGAADARALLERLGE